MPLPIAGVLAKLGLPFLLKLAGQGLAKVDHAAARVAADALGGVTSAIDSGSITPEQMAEANRHAERMLETQLAHELERLREVNATMRAETSSDDPYVRHWRPYWGYWSARAWVAQTVAILAAVVGSVGLALLGRAADAQILLSGVAELISALTVVWTVALSVLGIGVVARSMEKGARLPAMAGLLEKLARPRG